MIQNLITTAETYAKKCHRDTNHLYDGHPYEYHLVMTVNTAKQFLYLIPEPYKDIVIAACWAHDVIEDTRQTYNDVKTVLGGEVAEIVYAVTNLKGRNRKDRANCVYYAGINSCRFASFVKICDRLANALYSHIYSDTSKKNKSMALQYVKEGPYFRDMLENQLTMPMLDYLDELYKAIKKDK